MIQDKQIRDIELGGRQLSIFDAENDASADQERIMACLTGQVETHGQVDLEKFVQFAVDSIGMSEFQILQHLFWLVRDFKIQFRSNQGNIAPNEAKKILIESSEPKLKVVLNKSVDDTVFNRVQKFFNQITGSAGSYEIHDQSEFARRLTRQIRDWKQALESLGFIAHQPGFPGQKDIEDGLHLINAISDKLDAFSLIHSFSKNIEPLGRMVETIKTLSVFYGNHAERWQILVAFADGAKKELSGNIDNPSVGEAYERFNLILSSPQPYDRMDEAWRLYQTLKAHHDKIIAQKTQQYREKALSRVEPLIRKMRIHLDAHGADDDLRNRSLYDLRMKIKNINAARSIDKIRHFRLAAEEAFDLFWEEVGGTAPFP